MAAPYTPSAQVKLTNVAYIRLQKKGKRFEIACYRNKILSWRRHVETDIKEVLQIDTVFSNVTRGMLANTKDLLDAFGTTDSLAICKEILDKGETQVSEEERGAYFDSMFRDIAAIVADKAINPENNRPYTLSMIQNAMRQIHYGVSINKSAKSQALDVIRKLKDVMPIARASMLLRVVSPVSAAGDMKAFLVDQLGLEIINEATSTNAMDPMVSLDIRVDPETFRKIEEGVQEHTYGQGRLEVLLFRDSTPAKAPVVVAAKATTSTSTSGQQDGVGNKSAVTATAGGVGDGSSDKPAKKSGKSNKSKSSGVIKAANGQQVVEATAGRGNRNRATFAMLDSDSDDSDDSDIRDSKDKHDEVEDEGDHNSGSDDNDMRTAIELSLEDVAIEEGKEQLETADAHSEVGSEGEEASVSESDSDDDSEVVYGIVTSKNKTHKKKTKTQPRPPSTQQQSVPIPDNAISDASNAKDKKSKKAKRLEKEELKEKHKKMEVLRSRMEVEKARSTADNLAAVAATSASVSSTSAATQPSTATAIAANSSGGQSCNTCGGHFPDSAAYRNHFRSEWHRHNLKRKMKNLPVVTSEEEFRALPLDQIEI